MQHDPEIEKIMKEIPNEISPSELEYNAKIGQGQYGKNQESFPVHSLFFLSIFIELLFFSHNTLKKEPCLQASAAD